MTGSRRYFGNIRKRESGRYQARLPGAGRQAAIRSAYLHPQVGCRALVDSQGS